MDEIRRMGRFIAVFAIIGLVVSPMLTAATAKLLPAVELTSFSMLSADMPCCPDAEKSKNCRDCPLRAVCMVIVAGIAPALAARISAPLSTRCSFRGFDSVIADDLVGSPPDHPPRTLV